jgi:hypothetical protein
MIRRALTERRFVSIVRPGLNFLQHQSLKSVRIDLRRPIPMNVRKILECRLGLLLATLSLSLAMLGCGAGGSGGLTGSGGNGGGSGGGNGGGGASPSSMQGPWEIVFQSTDSANKYTALEVNLTQAGTHVFAGAPSALLYRSTGPYVSTRSLKVSEFGGQCDSNGTDEVTFDATLTNITATSETVAFTLTETGDLGSAVTTASVSTNGTQVSGTYSTAAACGAPEDNGTFSGYLDSGGVNDSYSGLFNGGSDAIMVTVVTATQGFGITFSGTDNGAPFTLQGSTVGFATELDGIVGGKPVKWFALYDDLYNDFLVYDSDVNFLGGLSESP